MAFLDALVVSVQPLLKPHLAVAVALVVLLGAATYLWPGKPNAAPALRDAIPYVSNTYQYMTDMKTFLWRAT